MLSLSLSLLPVQWGRLASSSAQFSKGVRQRRGSRAKVCRLLGILVKDDFARTSCSGGILMCSPRTGIWRGLRPVARQWVHPLKAC